MLLAGPRQRLGRLVAMLMRPVRAVFNERMKLYRGVGRVAFTGARNSYIYSYTTLFNLLYALHDIGVAVEGAMAPLREHHHHHRQAGPPGAPNSDGCGSVPATKVRHRRC